MRRRHRGPCARSHRCVQPVSETFDARWYPGTSGAEPDCNACPASFSVSREARRMRRPVTWLYGALATSCAYQRRANDASCSAGQTAEGGGGGLRGQRASLSQSHPPSPPSPPSPSSSLLYPSSPSSPFPSLPLFSLFSFLSPPLSCVLLSLHHLCRNSLSLRYTSQSQVPPNSFPKFSTWFARISRANVRLISLPHTMFKLFFKRRGRRRRRPGCR